MMDNDFDRFYRVDMDKMPVYTEDEERTLLRALAMGVPAVGSRLAEGSLHLVPPLAEEYGNRGVPMEDLVAEGNLELFLLIKELKGEGFEGDFKALAQTRIRKALEWVVAFRKDEKKFKTEKEIAARASAVKNSVAMLAKDLGW